MVENPIFDSGDQHPMFGVALTGKIPEWNPRHGTKGFAPWHEAVKDAALLARCTHFIHGEKAPTTQEIIDRFSADGVSVEQLGEYLAECELAWKEQNTSFYFLIRPSLKFSGDHEKDDLEYIQEHFQSADGQWRRGDELYRWALSFVDQGSQQAQSELRLQVATAKLKHAQPKLTQLETHSRGLLRDWAAIDGNEKSAPDSYYHQLLESIQPPTNTYGSHGSYGAAAVMIEVRKWVIMNMSPGMPHYSDPDQLLTHMLKFAGHMGLTNANDNAVNMVNGKVREANDCSVCSSYLCQSNKSGGPKLCVTMYPHNRTAQFLAQLSNREQKYLDSADSYMKEHPEVKSLKGVNFTQKEQSPVAQSTPAAPHATPILIPHPKDLPNPEVTDEDAFGAFLAHLKTQETGQLHALAPPGTYKTPLASALPVVVMPVVTGQQVADVTADAVKKAAKLASGSTPAQRAARLAMLRSTIRAVNAASKAKPSVKPECEEIVNWMEDEQKKSLQILEAKISKYEKRPLLTSIISMAKFLWWGVRMLFSLCTLVNIQRVMFIVLALAYIKEHYDLTIQTSLNAWWPPWFQSVYDNVTGKNHQNGPPEQPSRYGWLLSLWLNWPGPAVNGRFG